MNYTQLTAVDSIKDTTQEKGESTSASQNTAESEGIMGKGSYIRPVYTESNLKRHQQVSKLLDGNWCT